MLLKSYAKYPIKRTVVRVFHINSNQQDVRNLLIHNGQLPTTMIISFVSAAAFHGDRKLTPFNFKPYDLSSAQAFWAGRPVPIQKALEMDFDDENFTEAYFGFINNTGFGLNFSESNGIDLKQYKKSAFFIVFNFRADDAGDSAVDLIQFGETRLFLKYKKVLTENIKIIAYLSFDNVMRLDSNRNPIMDYAV